MDRLVCFKDRLGATDCEDTLTQYARHSNVYELVDDGRKWVERQLLYVQMIWGIVIAERPNCTG